VTLGEESSQKILFHRAHASFPGVLKLDFASEYWAADWVRRRRFRGILSQPISVLGALKKEGSTLSVSVYY
jgi:hypothetical protein